jgi:hypothetical protein
MEMSGGHGRILHNAGQVAVAHGIADVPYFSSKQSVFAADDRAAETRSARREAVRRFAARFRGRESR